MKKENLSDIYIALSLNPVTSRVTIATNSN